MRRIPSVLVKTWIFLIKSKDPNLAVEKFKAYRKIKQFFGSVQIAEIYVEQEVDDGIEVLII